MKNNSTAMQESTPALSWVASYGSGFSRIQEMIDEKKLAKYEKETGIGKWEPSPFKRRELLKEKCAEFEKNNGRRLKDHECFPVFMELLPPAKRHYYLKAFDLKLYELEETTAADDTSMVLYLREIGGKGYSGQAGDGTYTLNGILYVWPGDEKRSYESFLYKPKTARSARKNEMHAGVYKQALAKLDKVVTASNLSPYSKNVWLRWARYHLIEGFNEKAVYAGYHVSSFEELCNIEGIEMSYSNHTWAEFAKLFNITLKGKTCRGLRSVLVAIDPLNSKIIADMTNRKLSCFYERMLIDALETYEPDYGYNLQAGGDSRMHGIPLVWFSRSRRGVREIAGTREEIEKLCGIPSPEKPILDDYHWMLYAADLGYCISFVSWAPEFIYGRQAVKDGFYGGSHYKVLCKNGRIRIFPCKRAAELYNEMVKPDKEGTVPFVRASQIPVLYSKQLDLMDLGRITSLERGTEDAFNSATDAGIAVKIADGENPAYYWIEKNKAYWWSSSPIIDLNSCAIEFYTRLSDKCQVRCSGLDSERVVHKPRSIA